jgi:hypothetical protein
VPPCIIRVMTRTKRILIGSAVAAPVFACLIYPLFPKHQMYGPMVVRNPTELWAALVTGGVFGSALSIWGIVRWFNRRDDQRK